QQKVEEARKAMSRALNVMGQNLGQSVDPRAWARTHPWATLAGAAVGGFAAAAALTPTQEQTALRRIRELERALNVGRDVEIPADAVKPKTEKGVLSALLREVMKSAGPIISSTLAGAVAGKQASPQPVDASDAASTMDQPYAAGNPASPGTT
ncbi:MAG TPA: hypothetical protein VHM90_16420, partial [Phycisphaerae bacterium]|nr:hypothetical protein [Phycisphaerae bacterium]